MAAQPKIFSFFKRLGGVTTPTTRTTSMRRTLSWCYVFWHIRRVIVVDLYAVALERLPAGAVYPETATTAVLTEEANGFSPARASTTENAIRV
jgi:hypothetical protein